MQDPLERAVYRERVQTLTLAVWKAAVFEYVTLLLHFFSSESESETLSSM